MESPLITKSKTFSLNIIKLCRNIKNQSVLTNQLLRCATSIGANIHEAFYAHGKADFVAKLQISLKECYETEYWLDLLIESGIITKDYDFLMSDCIELKKILISSCKTAKGK